MNEARTLRPEAARDTVTIDGPLIVVRIMSKACDAIVASSLEAVEMVIAAGGRPVVLVIAGVNSAPPSAGMRAAIARHRRCYDGQLVAVAFVFEDRGFSGAVQRTAVSALQRLFRVKHPERVFATREDALEWLERYLPDRSTSQGARIAPMTTTAAS